VPHLFALTNDLAQAERGIAEHGLCLVRDVLMPRQTDLAQGINVAWCVDAFTHGQSP